MKIIEFRAENVKKLSLVHFKPELTKPLVIIAGKNGQGKSSLLDAVEMAIGGESHIPSKPLRRGQDKGSIDLDLGEYRVRRTFTPEGGTLTLWNRDGLKQPSPQAILNDLFNRHTFDPLAFKNAKPAERTDMLKQLLGLDFTGLDQEKTTVFDERTAVNRDIKSKETLIRANPRAEGAPAEEQSTAAIVDEQKKASEKNAANQQLRSVVTSRRGQLNVQNSAVTTAVKRVDEITLEIVTLKKKLLVADITMREEQAKAKTLQDELTAAETAVTGLQDIDLSPFAQRIRDLEQTNGKVRRNKEIDRHVADLTNYRRKAETLTDRLSAIERQKKEMIAAAKFPVAGLGLSDANEVTFNDIPFDQVNTADQLRVSVAIGLVLNPKLRVLMIHQGNDLDDDNLKLVAEMAAVADAQIWIERVSTSGEVSLILEDGHVKDQAPVEATPPAETQTP